MTKVSNELLINRFIYEMDLIADKPVHSRKRYIECKNELLSRLKERSQLQQQVENMKCCGNCKIDRTEKCRRKDEFTIGNEVCPDWQFDGLTRKERKV